MKELLFDEIDLRKTQLECMADDIFDYPECGYQEYFASKLLCSYLEQSGFDVERGVGGLETAFRAIFQHGTGGPSIGLLCEYDAIANFGHGCGHHMQGPAIVGAAAAIKNIMRENPYNLIVYGTPAEETGGGKIDMLSHGCFDDIDIALMFHGSPTTTTDIKCLAMSAFTVTFLGKSSHAAIQPESGRSALDALLLAFQGVEFLREHIPDDVRIHYTVLDGGGPENVVPAKAVGSFSLRSYNYCELIEVVKRFHNVLYGATLMTDTTYSVEEARSFSSKIPVLSLNALLMENASLVGAPCIRAPREKTGSTDFGNVMYIVPGSCIRVAFVPEGTPPHSEAYLTAGKSQEAHEALVYAAKILAATVSDLVNDKKLLEMIKKEFAENKAHLELR